MRRYFLIAFLFLAVTAVRAQYTVRIVVTAVPASHNGDVLYITGAFNRWSPADPGSILQKTDVGPEYTLTEVKEGLLEYKFTRGDWKTLESTLDGRLVAPRRAIIHSDTTLYCKIENWRDDFPESTASPRVKLWKDSMYIPQLGNYKRVWVYLPEDYGRSDKRYPVIYMHDGQDLFDEATSQGRIGPLEWGVDETIDSSKKAAIVVAVEHDHSKERRIMEYYVRPNSANPEVYGQAYLDFIVHTLKPAVDKEFRTQPDKAHTAMAGSSMGGLLTFYAGLLYPETFGVLGVLSPSIWLDEQNIYKEIATIKSPGEIKNQRYFFYGGGNENRLKPDGSFVTMNEDVLRSSAEFQKYGAEIRVSVNPEGRHGAWYWRTAFAEFYHWINFN
ncbi:alpha/beta hydrolase [Leadbetterella sp. DM7]|uniref:alpha/beta hydrolase n=1 Tax=Leadbetterella sp. DM7 TaxID=3235085 RepID=UPI00349EFE54